jgi:integrase-like protein
VATGERRERTLEHYRGALERHVLPRLGHRQLQLISADDLVALVSELRGQGLSPWTINGLLVPLRRVSRRLDGATAHEIVGPTLSLPAKEAHHGRR